MLGVELATVVAILRFALVLYSEYGTPILGAAEEESINPLSERGEKISWKFKKQADATSLTRKEEEGIGL